MKDILYSLLSDTKVLTVQDVFYSLLACIILGLLLYLSYKLSHSGGLYSKRFAVSLVGLTLITDMVMCVIGNNISLSLGMVGALSIVRFRTAIKDSRDTMYIFWAIGIGICCGVADYLIALMGSIAIFVVLMIFGSIQDNERILLVIRMTPQTSDTIHNLMKSLFEGKAKLSVHNASIMGDEVESIYEISDALLQKLEKKGQSITQVLANTQGITSYSLVRQEEEISS